MIKWLLRLGVAVGLLALVFRYVPFQDVARTLAASDPLWLLAAVGAVVFERLMIAHRIKMLTDRVAMKHTVWGLFEINAISTFYGTFLPGDLAGGAVRWYKMAKPTGQNAQALAAIVFERLIDTLALVLIGLLFWFLESPPFETATINIILLLTLGGLVFGTVFIVSPRASYVVRAVLAKLPNYKIRAVIEEKSEKVLSSVREFRQFSPHEFLTLIVLTVARHIFSIAILVFFAKSIAMDLGFMTLGWMRSIMNIIMMLPISFAGLGVKEGGFVILMAPYGIPGSQAVALSLLTFIAHMIFALIGGAFELKNSFKKV